MQLGIDFGTSYSTMCWWNEDKKIAETIRNSHGYEKTPSIVYGGDSENYIGQDAENILIDSMHLPEQEQTDALLRLRKSFKRDLRYNYPVSLPDGKTVTPVDSVVEILKFMKSTAEQICFHEEVKAVTLTHPVAWSQKEKDLLKGAGQKAGFSDIELLPEPVAAAKGYVASGAKIGNNILILDLGGGTLDLAFLHIAEDGEYLVPVIPIGDSECGGDDFDQVIYDHFEQQLKKSHGKGFSEKSGEVNPLVLLECRKAKEKLSTMNSARMSHFFINDSGGPERVSFSIARDEFDALVMPLVDNITSLAQEMCKRISSSGYDIDSVLLIGGATRTPVVKEKLSQVLSIDQVETMHVDVAVAMGASLVCVHNIGLNSGVVGSEFITPVRKKSYDSSSEWRGYYFESMFSWGKKVVVRYEDSQLLILFKKNQRAIILQYNSISSINVCDMGNSVLINMNDFKTHRIKFGYFQAFSVKKKLQQLINLSFNK